MKLHATTSLSESPIYSEFIADFPSLAELPLPSAHTVLLIVADAQAATTEVIASAASRLLSSGLIYVCVWGPDCERVHDIFDSVLVGDGTVEIHPSFMGTTWHSKDTLDEAIWFFAQCAWPGDNEIATTSYVAATIGNADWAVQVDHALANLRSLVHSDNENSGT